MPRFDRCAKVAWSPSPSIWSAAVPTRSLATEPRRTPNKIDLTKIDYYDPRDFWEAIRARNGRLDLLENEFYILASREDVGVPPQTAAEMVSLRHQIRRVPGALCGASSIPDLAGKTTRLLAARPSSRSGRTACLSPPNMAKPLDGCAMPIFRAAMHRRLYGEGIRSNYQGQGLRLAKHFQGLAHRTIRTSLGFVVVAATLE